MNESIFILSITIIGGLGNLRGSFYAAACLVLLPEVFRFIEFSDQVAAILRQIVYGVTLILLMTFGKKGCFSRS